MEYYNQLLFQQLAPALHINDSRVRGSPVALQLRSSFSKYNISHSHWDNCIIKNRLLSSKYLIKLSNSWDFGVEKKETALEGTRESHSVLSPFNPDSDIYPNGIISDDWFKKYIDDLPFAYVGVFSLGVDSGEDESLSAELEQLKLKCALRGVKFVAVLLSEQLVEEQGARMEGIRQQTGLQRLHGLFCLHANADANVNLARDITVLVSTLLSNLKNPAIEFYSGVEAKIRQRHKKYYSYPEVSKIKTKVELTPVFLETRNLIKQGIMFQFSNPHNVEMSLKYLIPAYDNLIELLRENFTDYTDMLEHDIKLYNHFRSLVDALAFHIARCYLAMEDSVTCLLRHKQHIAIIQEVCTKTSPGELSNWISVQYEWLAELIDLIPQSILPIAKKYNNSTLATVFFGGIQFEENGERYDITTKSGLLYIKAAEWLDSSSVSVSGNVYSLLPHYQNTEMVSQKKISLFKMAKAFFMDVETNSSSTPAVSNGSYVKYIDWLIAEEYYKLTLFNTAIEYYLSGEDESLQLYRLLDCYAKLDDKSKFLQTSIKLSMQKGVSALNFLPPHSKTPLFDGTLDALEIFKVTPFITNKDLLDMTYVYDECACQLEIEPLIDTKKLKGLLGVSKVKLNVKKIAIKFGPGFEDVNLDSESGDASFSLVELDEDKKGTFKFSEVDELKIIQFHQVAQKIGTIKIELIELESQLIIDEILIENVAIYKYEIKEPMLFHDIRFYLASNKKDNKKLSCFSYRDIRLNGLPNYAVKIYPVKPQVKLEIESLPKSIIIGEKLKLPIVLDIKEQKGVDLSKLSIVSNVKIEGGSDSEKFTIRTNWNDLKDDEPLRPKIDTKLAYLNLSVLTPPSMEVNGDSLLLEFKILLNDDDTPASNEEVDEYPTVFDLIKYEFEVLRSPFACKYGISPRYRNNPEDNDMPNPFIIDKESHISMPIATRVWNGKVTIINSIPLIEIVGTEISVKSQNPEVQLEEGELSKWDSLSSSMMFTTTSKTGFSHRNVIVSSIASVKWKRLNSDIVNEYRTKEWEITLPLSDPRVLLKVEEAKGLVKMHYVIENPTPRIFTFTTQLVSDDWELIEELNIVPSVQPAFPVLPFLRHVMDFYGKYNGQEKTIENIKLPQLRVYDVNYKVGLPILSVVDEVIASDGVLYWKNG